MFSTLTKEIWSGIYDQKYINTFSLYSIKTNAYGIGIFYMK